MTVFNSNKFVSCLLATGGGIDFVQAKRNSPRDICASFWFIISSAVVFATFSVMKRKNFCKFFYDSIEQKSEDENIIIQTVNWKISLPISAVFPKAKVNECCCAWYFRFDRWMGKLKPDYGAKESEIFSAVVQSVAVVRRSSFVCSRIFTYPVLYLLIPLFYFISQFTTNGKFILGEMWKFLKATNGRRNVK